MTSLDPDEIRAAQRAAWESSAPAWDTGGDSFYAATAPISDWLIEKLDPASGQRLLELAAGRGEISLTLAGKVAPDGSVICTDGAEAMVEIAERRASDLGIPDELLTHKPMDLEWIDADAASLDGIACRFGYMLCVDPEAAFHEARRVLKPGGRLVLSVWDQLDDNPWFKIVREEPVKAGLTQEPEPSVPGPFSLSAPGQLRELLAGAGFVEPIVESVEITFQEPSLDAAWDTIVGMSAVSFKRVLADASPAEHYKLRDAIEARWSEFAGPDGQISMPGRVLCALAEA